MVQFVGRAMKVVLNDHQKGALLMGAGEGLLKGK